MAEAALRFTVPVNALLWSHFWVSEAEQRFESGARKGFPNILSQTNLSPPDLSLHPAVNLVRMKTLPARLWTCDRHSANSSFQLKLCDQQRQKEKQGFHETLREKRFYFGGVWDLLLLRFMTCGWLALAVLGACSRHRSNGIFRESCFFLCKAFCLEQDRQ